jgi:protein-arginine kinase activator protein McsA
MPKARVCYICGRQYMLHSFEIHVAQCRDLFEKRENTKLPKERRKCPTDPTAGQSFGNTNMAMSRKDLDNLNAVSQQVWTAESLSKCRNCGRSFLPEKIGIHNKSCTADNPARRVDESVNRRVDNLGTPVQSNGTKSSGMKGSQGYNLNAGEGQSNFESGDMVECRDCGRSFNSQAFSK